MVRRSAPHASWCLIGVALVAAIGGWWLLQRSQTNHAPLPQKPPHNNGAGQGNRKRQADFTPVVLKTTREQNPDGGRLVAGGLRVDLSFRSEPDGYGGQWLVPQLLVRDDAAAGDLLTEPPLVAHEGRQSISGDGLVQIVELDPGNSRPEVVFAQHSGGAHCCALLTVFRADDRGGWATLDVGAFDGPAFVATNPLPELGYVLATRDNRFLGRFSSYVASSPPQQFLGLVDGEVADVSDQPDLRPLFLEDAGRYAEELTLRQNSSNGEINGLLAGYAASHARAGLIATAWPMVLDRYDRNSTLGLEECRGDYDSEGSCKGELLRYGSFPEALAAFLLHTGYVSEPIN